MISQKGEKKKHIYNCPPCAYCTDDKTKYNRHCSTRKHKNILNNTKLIPKKGEDLAPSFGCTCGKTYKHKNNLYAHKKKCTFVPPEPEREPETELPITASMFMKVLDDNKELRNLLLLQQQQIKEQQKQMAELIPKVGSGNTTNNNNQRFNLNVFLNETCKDAINWEDFMKSIEVGTKEFDAMVDSGLTEGVVKAICNGIQDLGVYKRPIHCIDAKRKKMCIKEEDAWNHDENAINGTLHQANVSLRGKYNNILKDWEKAHPNWAEDEEDTETYMKILGKVVGSLDEKKCVTEIAKNTVIPKE